MPLNCYFELLLQENLTQSLDYQFHLTPSPKLYIYIYIYIKKLNAGYSFLKLYHTKSSLLLLLLSSEGLSYSHTKSSKHNYVITVVCNAYSDVHNYGLALVDT